MAKKNSMDNTSIKIIDIIDEHLSDLRSKNSPLISPTLRNILWFSWLWFLGSFLIGLFLLLANPGTFGVVVFFLAPAFIFIIAALITYLFVLIKKEVAFYRERGIGWHFTKNRIILDTELLEATKTRLQDQVSPQERNEFLIKLEYRKHYEIPSANVFLGFLPVISSFSALSIKILDPNNKYAKQIENMVNSDFFALALFASALFFLLGFFIKFYLAPKWDRYTACVKYSLARDV